MPEHGRKSVKPTHTDAVARKVQPPVNQPHGEISLSHIADERQHGALPADAQDVVEAGIAGAHGANVDAAPYHRDHSERDRADGETNDEAKECGYHGGHGP